MWLSGLLCIRRALVIVSSTQLEWRFSIEVGQVSFLTFQRLDEGVFESEF